VPVGALLTDTHLGLLRVVNKIDKG
jgi:hypothetical protein